MAKQYDVKALRKQVLESDDIKYDEVYVEEWDVKLPVKTLSSKEMKEVTKHNSDSIRMAILAVLYGCATEEGERVFDLKDLAAFENDRAFKPLFTVSNKVLDMSGFNEKATDDAKNN